MKLLIIPVLSALWLASACSRTTGSGFVQMFENSSVSVLPERMTEENIWGFTVDTYLDANYANYIKFSIELDETGQITGLIWHPNTFTYHADHLVTLPAYAGLSRTQFDGITLHNENRRILLGTALSLKSEDFSRQNSEWDIQFIGQDRISPALIASAIRVLRGELIGAKADNLFYLPSPEQNIFAAADQAELEGQGIKLAKRPMATSRLCYANGWGAGYVRILKSAELEEALKSGLIFPDEILVLESIPRELPPVAGLIIASPSSPSSHPALLAQMLGIPFFYEPGALANERWIDLANRREPVFMEARGTPGGSCELLLRDGKALTNADVSRLRRLKTPSPLKLEPYVNLGSTAAISLSALGMEDARKVGAKAANVAELLRVIPGHTIEGGLALPLSAFARFLKEGRTEAGDNLEAAHAALVAKLLAADLPLSETIPLLAQLRKLIEKSQIPSALAEEILKSVHETFPAGTRIKLRSSSNLEDLPQFNGAGLYESKGACVGDDKGQPLCEAKLDPVLKALKGVWASLYTMKAWVARRTFTIEEANVGMGVLIQKSYQDELANGVAIASYPMGAYFGDGHVPAIEVMASGFPGEENSVTNPPPGKIPETVRLQGEWKELISSSSELPRGRPLLSPKAYDSLYQLTDRIFKHYEGRLKPRDRYTFALDFEWKLIEQGGEERIVIKQVRPVPSPSESTQGFGFGSMVIGESEALLCPTVQEDTDSLSKLKLSMPLGIDVALHEVPFEGSDAIPNPIRSLKVDGQTLKLPLEAKVTVKEDWTEQWGSSHESRLLAIETAFDRNGAAYNLSWSLKQTRSTLEKKRLIDGVQSLWSLEYELEQAGKKQRYAMVLGQKTCQMDAYQGIQPGSLNAAASYSAGRKEPVPYRETFESIGPTPYKIDIKAKTAFQGFDKTRFLGIDEVSIEGLLDHPIVLSDKIVYAPGHHNFQWSYAFDLLAARGLDAKAQAALAKLGYRYLFLDYFDSAMFGWARSLSMGLDSPGVGGVEMGEEEPSEQTFQLHALTHEGVRVDLGKLRLTFRTNLYENF